MSLIGAIRHDSRPAVEVVQRIVISRIEVERFLEVRAGIEHLGAHLKPLEYFRLYARVERVTLVAVGVDLHDTVLASIAQANVVVRLAGRATDVEVVLLREAIVVHVHLGRIP